MGWWLLGLGKGQHGKVGEDAEMQLHGRVTGCETGGKRAWRVSSIGRWMLGETDAGWV